MAFNFNTVGYTWAASNNATEVPSNEEIREYAKTTYNYSPKRVTESDCNQFIAGVNAFISDSAEPAVEEAPKPKRKYTKKATPEVTETPAEETAEEATEETNEETSEEDTEEDA